MASTIEDRDVWATATGEEEGLPIVYRFRQNRPFAAQPDKLPIALRVVWRYDGSLHNGMPNPDASDAQIFFEDAIGPLIEGPASFLMLVFTGNFRREWLFYTGDPDKWASTLTTLLMRHPPYPLEIEDWPDESWSTWADFSAGVTD